MEDKMDMKEKFSQGWIHLHIIIEILGKPASHLEEVMKAVVEKLRTEKDVEVLSSEIAPATNAEEEGAEEVFTIFAEIELLAKGMAKITDIVFDYMPASVEIVNPPAINFKLEDANTLLNDVASRLHQYDALSKQFKLERDYFAGKLMEIKKAYDAGKEKLEKENQDKKEEN